MIEDYERSIERIEERIAQLQMMDNMCKADKVTLIKLYEEELMDLYAIVRYLRSPTASNIFPDLYKPFNRAQSSLL